jgi:hypothetical protein
MNGELRIVGSTSRMTQANLARALGLSPQTLANFLSQTNDSIGGLAVARACSIGFEFECEGRRIGRLDRPSAVASNEDEQLVLEFSSDFRIIPESLQLSVACKKGPGRADIGSESRFRLKIER